MQTQALQLSPVGNDFKYGLVKGYGNKHNHELDQFKKVKEILQKEISDSRLLGNVKAGRSLDALLLTTQAVIILEFKDYEGEVQINAQHQFLVFDNEGKRKTDKNGNPLVVEGGSFSDPLEQAKANRIALKEKLKVCFGKNSPESQIPVYLIIIFNGTMKVKGIEHLDKNLEWCSVMDMNSFVSCIHYRMEKGNGLSLENQEKFIEFLDANQNVLEEVDIFEEAKHLFELGDYYGVLLRLDRCDPTDKKVTALTLRTYYYYKDKRFTPKVAQCLCYGDAELEATANELLGLAYYYGNNGYPKDNQKAMKHLKACASKYNHSDLIENLETIEKNNISFDNEWEMMKGLDETKNFIGNFISSIVMILLLIIFISQILPFKPLVTFIVLLFASMGLIFATNICDKLGEPNFMSVIWEKCRHASTLYFQTCKVASKEYNDPGDRITYIMHWAGFFLLKIMFFYGVIFLLDKFLDLAWISNSIKFLNNCSGINIRTSIMVSTIGFMVVYLGGYMLLAFGHMKNKAIETYPEAAKGQGVYCLCAPKIFTGWRPTKGFGYNLAREAVIFGFTVTAILFLVSWLKPFLYHWIGSI